jgi:hypothetical protein
MTMLWLRRLVANLSPPEAVVRSRVTPCEICGGKSGSGIGFTLSSSVSSVNIITPWLSSHMSPGACWWLQFRDIVSLHRYRQEEGTHGQSVRIYRHVHVWNVTNASQIRWGRKINFVSTAERYSWQNLLEWPRNITNVCNWRSLKALQASGAVPPDTCKFKPKFPVSSSLLDFYLASLCHMFE